MMDRLTVKNSPDGWPAKWADIYELVACSKDPEWCVDWKNRGQCKCDAVGDCINRLGRYEDTGLTPDEVAALRAENEQYRADIEAGRMVRLESCDECRYKLESHAWNYYSYPCNECRQRVKSNFMKPEAARAALGRDASQEEDT
jgi:hypothetical protein